MLQIFAGLFLSAIFFNSVWAKCDETKVSIPLDLEKESCFKETSSLGIVTESIKNNFIDFEISTLQADFINVPDSQTHQFFLIENDEETNDKIINMVSFLCSGEFPIGADAISARLTRSSDKSETETDDVTIFISTGQAAQNISVSQKLKAKAKIYDRFLVLFEERAGMDLTEDMITNLYVPNLIQNKVYANFFSRTSSSINACSKNFQNTMKDLMLDQVVKTQPYKEIDIRKKRFTTKYRLRMKL